MKGNLDFLFFSFFLLDFLFGYLSSIVLHWIFEEIILYILLTCATMNSDVWCNTCSIQTYVIKHINILWGWGWCHMLSSSTLLLFTEETMTIFYFSHKFMEKNYYIDLNDAKNKTSDLAVFNKKFLSNLKKKIPILMSRKILKKNLGRRKTKLHTKSWIACPQTDSRYSELILIGWLSGVGASN